MELFDSVALTGVRQTRDGYLVGIARIARTGIYHYGGSELGRPDLPLVRVFRPEDEVFDQKAMAGFAYRPITNNHPTEAVTAANWKDVAVGQIGGEIARDGSFLSVPLILMDAQAVEDFTAGKREVSAGYSCDIEWTAGTSPDGEPYDAIQRGISPNHLAIVDRGRAGPECRIGDAARQSAGASTTTPATTPSTTAGDRAMPDEIRTVVVDGLSIPVTTQGAEAIALLQRRLADAAASTTTANTRVQDAETAHRTALEARDGQIAALRAEMARAVETKDGEIAGLRAAHQAALEAKDGEITALRAQTNDAALDQRVAARSALIAQVRPILGDAFNPAGMTDAAIRKAVVVQALGANLADADTKGDAYFDAAFDAIMKMPRAQAQAPAQPQQMDAMRVAIATGGPAVADSQNQVSPWEANRLRTVNAWKEAV